MVAWIKKSEYVDRYIEKHPAGSVIFFHGDFSDASKRALREIKAFSRENPEIPVAAVNVGEVKTIHKKHDVRKVPTVVIFKEGKKERSIEGVESARFYESLFFSTAPAVFGRSRKKDSKRVTVYSSPHCPACGSVKNYLRSRGVGFTEIDISRDTHAAQQLVARSGQQAVPQVDINGRIVVGFDENKLNTLLQ